MWNAEHSIQICCCIDAQEEIQDCIKSDGWFR